MDQVSHACPSSSGADTSFSNLVNKMANRHELTNRLLRQNAPVLNTSTNTSSFLQPPAPSYKKKKRARLQPLPARFPQSQAMNHQQRRNTLPALPTTGGTYCPEAGTMSGYSSANDIASDFTESDVTLDFLSASVSHESLLDRSVSQQGHCNNDGSPLPPLCPPNSVSESCQDPSLNQEGFSQSDNPVTNPAGYSHNKNPMATSDSCNKGTAGSHVTIAAEVHVAEDEADKQEKTSNIEKKKRLDQNNGAQLANKEEKITTSMTTKSVEPRMNSMHSEGQILYPTQSFHQSKFLHSDLQLGRPLARITPTRQFGPIPEGSGNLIINRYEDNMGNHHSGLPIIVRSEPKYYCVINGALVPLVLKINSGDCADGASSEEPRNTMPNSNTQRPACTGQMSQDYTFKLKAESKSQQSKGCQTEDHANTDHCLKRKGISGQAVWDDKTKHRDRSPRGHYLSCNKMATLSGSHLLKENSTGTHTKKNNKCSKCCKDLNRSAPHSINKGNVRNLPTKKPAPPPWRHAGSTSGFPPLKDTRDHPQTLSGSLKVGQKNKNRSQNSFVGENDSSKRKSHDELQHPKTATPLLKRERNKQNTFPKDNSTICCVEQQTLTQPVRQNQEYQPNIIKTTKKNDDKVITHEKQKPETVSSLLDKLLLLRSGGQLSEQTGVNEQKKSHFSLPNINQFKQKTETTREKVDEQSQKVSPAVKIKIDISRTTTDPGRTFEISNQMSRNVDKFHKTNKIQHNKNNRIGLRRHPFLIGCTEPVHPSILPSTKPSDVKHTGSDDVRHTLCNDVTTQPHSSDMSRLAYQKSPIILSSNMVVAPMSEAPRIHRVQAGLVTGNGQLVPDIFMTLPTPVPPAPEEEETPLDPK